MEINYKFCAFVDILGFKNKMSNFDDALNYYKQYFSAYESFDKSHDKLLESVRETLEVSTGDSIEEKVESVVFSDSIILISSNWKAFLFRLSNISSLFMSYGFVFRGGIGFGKHYSEFDSNKTYIVSEGLVQAVEIESNFSVYPRIVISQIALEEVLKSAKSLYDVNNMFIQNEDNMWFINPFF